MYTNANGLHNKMDELKQHINDYQVDILCITETHFSQDILDAEIQLDGFIMFIV